MRNIESIIDDLEEIQTIKDRVKAHAMVYQYDLKVEVSKALGLTVNQVDLPYRQWVEIRDRYLRDNR